MTEAENLPAVDAAPEDLGAAILAASRELVAAKFARPRDPERVEAAVAELERLKALRDG